MKNIFVKTALALFLIPGFLLTSVVSAQAEWTLAPGAVAGKLLGKVVISSFEKGVFSPETLCLPLGLDTPVPAIDGVTAPSYAQFVSEPPAGPVECWYYDSDTANGSGEGGENTWRWDD